MYRYILPFFGLFVLTLPAFPQIRPAAIVYMDSRYEAENILVTVNEDTLGTLPLLLRFPGADQPELRIKYYKDGNVINQALLMPSPRKYRANNGYPSRFSLGDPPFAYPKNQNVSLRNSYYLLLNAPLLSHFRMNGRGGEKINQIGAFGIGGGLGIQPHTTFRLEFNVGVGAPFSFRTPTQVPGADFGKTWSTFTEFRYLWLKGPVAYGVGIHYSFLHHLSYQEEFFSKTLMDIHENTMTGASLYFETPISDQFAFYLHYLAGVATASDDNINTFMHYLGFGINFRFGFALFSKDPFIKNIPTYVLH